MQIPADRIAKRISAEDWRARYDLPPQERVDRIARRLVPPADRVAVRAR